VITIREGIARTSLASSYPETRSAGQEKKNVLAGIGSGWTGAGPVSVARSACGQHVNKATAGDPDIIAYVYVTCCMCAMHPRVPPCGRCIHVRRWPVIQCTATELRKLNRERGRERGREKEKRTTKEEEKTDKEPSFCDTM